MSTPVYMHTLGCPKNRVDSEVMLGTLTQAELFELLAASGDPEAQAVLARTPAILRDTLTFPYTTGLTYISAIQSQGGWEAVNGLFTKMPASTEQILHPEKASEAPVAVTLPGVARVAVAAPPRR